MCIKMSAIGLKCILDGFWRFKGETLMDSWQRRCILGKVLPIELSPYIIFIGLFEDAH